MTAAEAWRARVEAHHEQSRRYEVRAGVVRETYEGRTAWFRDDPYRTGDPVLEALRREIPVTASVLDVGGGAGRFAVPLALDGRKVVVVEPSPTMVAALREASDATGCSIPVIESAWETADAPVEDVVLCANVVYGLADLVPFVRKLEAHAAERVVVLASMQSPLTQVSGLWAAVHGEIRVDLPGVPELLDVLWEMGIFPDVWMIEGIRSAAARDRQAAERMVRGFLYVRPGSEEEARLEALLPEWLIETPGGFALKDAPQRRQALIAWQPAGNGS